jgi:hypothetical protein
MELSKKDKKVAREIIEKGVQIEFANGLNQADAVIQKWKNNHLGNREAYHLLFKKIKDFDKHIARRYDAMRGSRYFLTVANLFADRIITEEDIKDFSKEVIEELYITRDLWNSNSSE